MSDSGPRRFTLDDANAFRSAVGESVRAIRRTETTPDGWTETLGFLTRDGARSIAALARLRGVRHQTMSATVADLEAKGLVLRAPDPADARGVLISLTDAGTDVIADLRIRRSSQVLAAADAVLTPDERATLIDATAVLAKLTAALREAAREPEPAEPRG